ATVLDSGSSQVSDATAASGVAAQPVLFIPAPRERLIEWSERIQRASADRHVGAPHQRGVTILVAEVERRDRGWFSPTGARSSALQPSADGPPEHVHVGRRGGPREDRSKPFGWRLDVVVDKHH